MAFARLTIPKLPKDQDIRIGEPVAVTVRVKGVKDLSRRTARVRRKIAQAVTRGQKKAAEFLLKEARKITPVRTRKLQSESKVERVGRGFFEKTQFFVIFGPTGSISERYALIQHEFPRFKKKRTDKNPNAQWKFLETPVRRFRSRMGKIVAEEVRQELRRSRIRP